MYSFPNLEPVCCSMSSSNCCFLTCIQISQEAGQLAWYSHLFKTFPQFVVIHTVKGFGVVNKVKVDVFLELSCIFVDPTDVGNLISDCSGFSWSTLPEALNCYNLATLYSTPYKTCLFFPKHILRDVIIHLSTVHERVACGKNGPWVGRICVWILSFKNIIWGVDYFIYPSISLFSF